MQVQELINWYQAKTDEELVELAADSEQLTPEAQTALTSELARRRLDVRGQTGEPCIPIISPGPEELPAQRSLPPYQTGKFIAEVLRTYHAQLWFFLKLIAPAVVGSYVTVFYSLRVALQIARRLVDSGYESYSTVRFELLSLVLTRYLISWVLFFFAFAAICVAVSQMEEGNVPSLQGSSKKVWRSTKPLLKLCLLLFLMGLIVYAISAAFSTALLWMSFQMHFHIGRPAMVTSTFLFWSLLLLVLSRFSLTVPAVVLDHSRVWQAIFRSDELTEGKWLTLAVLLAKSLIGGYIFVALPYWLSPWVPSHIANLAWYPWIQSTLSIIAIMLVEPPMFIGFAMLYLRMSKEASARLNTVLAS